MRIATVLALLLALLAAGCGSDDDSSTATSGGSGTGAAGSSVSAERLDGRTFLSSAVRGRELVDGTQVTLTFQEGGLGVSAGCNTMGGAFAVEDGTLRWSAAPATTMIGCEPALQRQDEWLTRFLAGGVELSAPDARTLLLSGDGGVEVTLTEGADASQPPPIVGTSWTLVTIGDRSGTASSVPAGVEAPTLRFTADGRAEVFAGCNRGGGRAQVRDDGFAVFGPLALTRMACEQPAMKVEALVTSILDGRVALGFSGADLSVAKDGRSLVFRAG